MLNINANCYNIENNFKYRTVISTFSEHITIFRTLSIDIWLRKCQQRLTNKTENKKLFSANFSEISNCCSSSFWEKPLWNQKFLLLTATVGRSCYLASKSFSKFELFSIFSQTFLELIFVSKIKTMFLKQSAVLFTSC